jgi:undecaprenyl pyrophosphate phosphatase UppP
MFCKTNSVAEKSYRRDVLRLMVAYAVVLFGASWFVRHDGAQHFFLYFWSVMPAIPILAVMIRMGKYLREEKDEYQRLMAMQAILVGTAALLATLVVSDFLRAFANTGTLPAFAGFLIFVGSMAAAQAWQKLRNRMPADE